MKITSCKSCGLSIADTGDGDRVCFQCTPKRLSIGKPKEKEEADLVKQQIDLKTQYPQLVPAHAVHRIEIDLVSEGGFSGTIVKEISGNPRGGQLFIGLLDELVDDFAPNMDIDLNAKHCIVVPEDDPLDEGGYISKYVLFNEHGERAEIEFGDIVPHIVGMRVAACWSGEGEQE